MSRMSKKETVLVLVLLLAVIGYSVYRFIYVPKAAEMAVLKTELEITENERISVENKIAAIPKLEQEISEAAEAAQKGAPLFFNKLVQENLITLLCEMAEEASFRADSYSFSPIAASSISAADIGSEELQYYLKQLVNDYISKYGAAEQMDASVDQHPTSNPKTDDISGELAKADISVSFTCTYEELMSYLKVLETYEKEIIVSSLNISSQGKDNLSGTMNLSFYELPKFFPNVSDLEFLAWRYNIPKGKDNPFGNGGIQTADLSLTPVGNQGNLQKVSYRNPDFFVIGRAVASGMPTMTVGYAPDTIAETYIRSTTEGEDNVTVELTGQSGKYYYKFTTAARTYPETGRVEFFPINNDIRFIIYSSKRKDDNDTNMINVSIINDTGLELNWIVDGDDTARPRVNVTVR